MKLSQRLREAIDECPTDDPWTLGLIKTASEAAIVLEMYDSIDFKEIKDDLIYLAAYAGDYPERLKNDN